MQYEILLLLCRGVQELPRAVLPALEPSDEPEAGSVEVSPNITTELNAKGDLIGIEILSASTFIRDSVLESVQARVLDLAEAKTA